ncbi:uncharacterized protein LOC126797126 [Argentina anserina]|uniref:uncharacterized protein LOC126797126 n=1 Tax=Argentina anserina TaxID=57926 RepID=UPI00217653AD|nr:uncharacterized protein LOC126797126 [Potentilla anserina]
MGLQSEALAGRPKRDLKRAYATRSGGECSRLILEEEFSSESTDSDDPMYDAIVDSDYELNEEDDDVLFQRNVDGDTNKVHEFDEMGYEGNISDVGEDSDGFKSVHSSDSEGEDQGPFRVNGKKRFSNWVEFNVKTDMKNPIFCIGMVFPNNEVFKHAVRKHVVLTKKELRFPRNTKHQVLVRCKTSPGCPFWLYASSTNENNSTMQVVRYTPEHKCSSVAKRVYHCHAPFLAEEYKSTFMADGKWSREGIQNKVIEDFGMHIGYAMCYRAKSRAKKLVEGTIEEQYDLLESYACELKKRNLGTTIWIPTELDENVRKFKRIYICVAALREGWKAGCRPIIGLVGCHLKGVHKGQLLSAVGIDDNNGMYPIAWAIVEKEMKDSWSWFMTSLKDDLEINRSMAYAFISDKQK